ncbi:MAG: DUF4139 domain-containing protein [Magnetospirillum sp.]|nr:DUF4139 domain-containing protein [Magnetospirillum sp.]
MPRRRLFVLIAAAALGISVPADAGDGEAMVGTAGRSGLTLVIAQDGRAQVRDRRPAVLDKGAGTLVFDGIARLAEPGSATLAAPGVTVREQSLDLDGIAAERLLARALGHDVTVVWRDGERETRARVLAADGTPVFLQDGKVVAGTPARILYDALPSGLHPTPVFRAAVIAESAGRRDLDLGYQTGGLGWRAEYAGELMPGSDKLALAAWAVLDNQSGADYPAARIQLLAGEPAWAAAVPLRRRATVAVAAAAMAGDPEREGLGPHHLYTLAHPVGLADGEHKQVPLLPPATLAATRLLVLDPLPPHGWRDRLGDLEPQHPGLRLSFVNGTGAPLPAGTLRVAQRAKDGTAVPVGETRLPPLPAGATATLALGEAFDVTARRVQTDFRRVSAEITEAAWEVRLANGGDSPATVSVGEAFGGDWLVVDESRPHRKDNAFAASWSVPVPAKGEATVRYRVRVKN